MSHSEDYPDCMCRECHLKRIGRIAELEAENARLKELLSRGAHADFIQVLRERDEARAETGRLKSQHEIWISDLRRERDEARDTLKCAEEALGAKADLACMQRDEARVACAALGSYADHTSLCTVTNGGYDCDCGYVHARASTAGSELLPSIQMLDEVVKENARLTQLEIPQLKARLEKAERPVICTGCSKAITADDPMPDCATCSAEEFEEMVAQLKKVQATAEQEESKLRGVNREMSARLEKAEAERESMRRLAADLNAKLDDTHTHRCFRCDATVTGEEAMKFAVQLAVEEAIRRYKHRAAMAQLGKPSHPHAYDEWLAEYEQGAALRHLLWLAGVT